MPSLFTPIAQQMPDAADLIDSTVACEQQDEMNAEDASA